MNVPPQNADHIIAEPFQVHHNERLWFVHAIDTAKDTDTNEDIVWYFIADSKHVNLIIDWHWRLQENCELVPDAT